MLGGCQTSMANEISCGQRNVRKFDAFIFEPLRVDALQANKALARDPGRYFVLRRQIARKQNCTSYNRVGHERGVGA
jgi:hypothetical protein